MKLPWEGYACTAPPKRGFTVSCSPLHEIHHATHTATGLRILDDRKIASGLIYDECSLNKTRTQVIWLSPNDWYYGSRYGNVQFTFELPDLLKDQSIYWVEAQTGYSPHACRFLITSEDVSHLPVTPYDPVLCNGPLRRFDDLWYWNGQITLELMLRSELTLRRCKKIDLIKHHDRYCALGNCNDLGKSGDSAAGRLIAHIISRDITVYNDCFIVTEPKRVLATSVELGISRICLALGATKNRLNGPLNAEASVNAVLRASLLQLAHGEHIAAKETAALIGSDKLLYSALGSMVEAHFGLKSSWLAD